MKNYVKKIMLLVLACIMLVSFAGCGDSTSQTNVKEGEIPDSITAFAVISSNAVKAGAKDKNDITAFQMIEEATGCHVEWTNPSPAAANEQFNLLIASGKYPDVIMYYWPTIPGGMQQYVDDGVIVPLSDYMDFMPNLKKFGEDNPEIRKQYTLDDGSVLFAPALRKDDKLRVFLGPAIRQDWLDKLGLKMPTNTDELYEVLKAFKTQDPNGNGKADEIPFTGMKADDLTFGIANLVYAFDTHFDFYIKDGKVTHGMLENNMKEALTYLNKLYSEGLLDVDYLVNDDDKYQSKIMNDKSGFYFCIQPSKYYNAMNDGTKQIKAVPYINGKCYNTIYKSNLGEGAAITTACKNPAGVAKWLDFFYSEEGTLIANYGKKGLTYDVVNGKNVFNEEYVFNNPDGLDCKDVLAKNTITMTTDFPSIQLWEAYSQTLKPWGKDAVEVWSESADISGALPPLMFTQEELDTISSVTNELKTYISEAINYFIIGKRDISEFDTVKENLISMGMDELIDIYNDAYVRYQAK